MTDTERKLRDAETQFRLAMQNHGDEETVRSCINAVISHGRSVTLVMQAESGATGLPLRAWYDRRMAELLASPRGPLLKFFNDQRVHTIHRGVVAPQQVTTRAMEFRVNGIPTNSEPTVTFYRFEGVRDYLPRSQRWCVSPVRALPRGATQAAYRMARQARSARDPVAQRCRSSSWHGARARRVLCRAGAGDRHPESTSTRRA